MLVESIWVANTLRNFNYIIVCQETGDALVIDPLDHKKCLEVCAENDWTIRQILNTHEHWDHIGGNAQIVKKTGAKILAHHNAGNTIDGMNTGLHAGDAIRIGNTIELEVLDTPGHTMTHVCVVAHGNGSDGHSAIFSGDTLFNAGAGNCHHGGHPEELFDTFSNQIHQLDSQMQIYPGHDYLVNNLEFTLDREPGNKAAAALLKSALTMDPERPLRTTIAQEQQINTFFRLQQPEIVDKLCAEFDNLPANPNAKTVFLKLRELRNHW